MKDRSAYLPRGCNQRWTITCDGSTCNHWGKPNKITLFKRDFSHWSEILEKAGWKILDYCSVLFHKQDDFTGTCFLCPRCAGEYRFISKTIALVHVKADVKGKE